jgi:UDP-N-acetylglucosamine 2-epimerase (non-hydrolysing)
MKIACVVGARPNFMKMGPIVLELTRRGTRPTLLHTGQHYDANMSQVFFDELGLPAPDVHLGVGSGTHARQTAAVMVALEDLWLADRPDLVVVAGDVNSTAAAALVTAKLTIPLAHVESGLRSFDRTMPEEVNRIVTDALADLLFTTEPSADANLAREGIPAEKVHRVGNCMIDTLFRHKDRAVAAAPWEQHGLAPNGYGLVTLHRPANVDDDAALARTLRMLEGIAAHVPLLFPVHPRTRARLDKLPRAGGSAVHLVEPLPYLAFTGLMAKARLVLTDSGGVQEETTALGVPCVTMRDNTERPITVDEGTNILAGTDPDAVQRAALDVLGLDVAEERGEHGKTARVPDLWDGQAARRTVDVIEAWAARPSLRERATTSAVPAVTARGQRAPR